MNYKLIKSINHCSQDFYRDIIVRYLKKLNLILLLILQSICYLAHASNQEYIINNQNLPIISDQEGEVFSDHSTLTWTLLPHESLEDLAMLFYPKNKIMQQKFIIKTLNLSKDVNPNLTSTKSLNQASLIVIPNIKLLGNYAERIKSKSLMNSSEAELAKLSFQQSVSVKEVESFDFSPRIQAIYNDLMRRNAIFKQSLKKLNSKLANLQQVFVTIKVDLVRIIDIAYSIAESRSQTINAQKLILEKNDLPSNSKSTNTQDSSIISTQVDEGAYHNWRNHYGIWDLLIPVVLLLLVMSSFLYVRRHLLNYHPTLDNRDKPKEKKVVVTNSDNLSIERATIVQYESIPTTESVFSGSIPGLDSNIGNVLEQRKEADLALEQAKIYANINRFKEAIMLLKIQIQETPKAAIHHWFYLLDLCRKYNQKDAFISNAKQLHEKFNVMPPQWESTGFPILAVSSLEELPHIVDKLTKLWVAEAKMTDNLVETRSYLDELLTDNRSTERMGFGVEVFQEILLLRDVLDMRLKMSLDGQS